MAKVVAYHEMAADLFGPECAIDEKKAKALVTAYYELRDQLGKYVPSVNPKQAALFGFIAVFWLTYRPVLGAIFARKKMQAATRTTEAVAAGPRNFGMFSRKPGRFTRTPQPPQGEPAPRDVEEATHSAVVATAERVVRNGGVPIVQGHGEHVAISGAVPDGGKLNFGP